MFTSTCLGCTFSCFGTSKHTSFAMLVSETGFGSYFHFFSLQAHIFKSESGACAAFLANYDSHSFANVAYGEMHYHLPPWSISILPDCKHTVYNTARVRKNK